MPPSPGVGVVSAGVCPSGEPRDAPAGPFASAGRPRGGARIGVRPWGGARGEVGGGGERASAGPPRLECGGVPGVDQGLRAGPRAVRPGPGRSSRGEVFGFVGPNGAGKTTTIRLLMDLIRPDRGTASILGLDSRRDSREIKRRVGYLPGELPAFPGVTRRVRDRPARGAARGCRSGPDRSPGRAAGPRPGPALPVAVARQQAEGPPGAGVHARPGGADPRRADPGPGPADAAGVPGPGGRGGRRWGHGAARPRTCWPRWS